MKFVRDNLFDGRTDSDRAGIDTGAGDDGRLDGRKKEGFLRTFIVIFGNL